MNVGQLIEELSQYEDKMEVWIRDFRLGYERLVIAGTSTHHEDDSVVLLDAAPRLVYKKV